MKDTKYLLALHRGLNLTYPRYQKLKDHFKSDWEAAFSANISDWIQARIDKRGIEKWFSQKAKINPDQEWELLQKCDAKVLRCDDENFPIALQHISGPPALLFVRGELKDEDWTSISVVGARRISQYGKRALEKILTPIAQAQITIVSGLAYGADTLAHTIALENKSRTIAVLGNGIDHIYPVQNQHLAKKIIDNGAIISEFLPQTVARPEYFPARNRIVAGLSQGTLIAEAAIKSGSLITANYCADFGREVFAIPGEIFNPNAAGTNRLIRDGAHCTLSGEQVLSTLGIQSQSYVEKINFPTSGIEHDILKKLKVNQQYQIDEITQLSGFPHTTISAHLMLMEMKGWVKNLGGQIYVRNI